MSGAEQQIRARPLICRGSCRQGCLAGLKDPGRNLWDKVRRTERRCVTSRRTPPPTEAAGIVKRRRERSRPKRRYRRRFSKFTSVTLVFTAAGTQRRGGRWKV